MNEKCVHGRATAGIPATRPVKHSSPVYTKIKLEPDDDHSYSLSSIPTQLSSIREPDIVQQPCPWSSSIKSEWNYLDTHNDTKSLQIQTSGEIGMARYLRSRSLSPEDNWDHLEEYGSMQSQALGIRADTDHVEYNASANGYQRQNLPTTAETRHESLYLGNTNYLNQNIAIPQLTDIESTRNTMYEYEKMMATYRDRWCPTAVKIEGESMGQMTGCTSIPSWGGLVVQPQTNQIAYKFPNHVSSLTPPILASTSCSPLQNQNRDIRNIPTLQNTSTLVANSCGPEKIDDDGAEPFRKGNNDYPSHDTIKSEKIEMGPQSRNVSMPRPTAGIKAKYEIQHPKTDTHSPESLKNDSQKMDHSQSEEGRHPYTLPTRAKDAQQKAASESSPNERPQISKQPYSDPGPAQVYRFKGSDNGDEFDLLQGPYSRDELDWLIEYNRQNIPKEVQINTNYWRKAAIRFNEEFKKKRSPKSLLRKFWNGDTAARIRKTRLQAPTTGSHLIKKVASTTTGGQLLKRPTWAAAETAWFVRSVCHKRTANANLTRLGQAYKGRFRKWEGKRN